MKATPDPQPPWHRTMRRQQIIFITVASLLGLAFILALTLFPDQVQQSVQAGWESFVALVMAILRFFKFSG